MQDALSHTEAVQHRRRIAELSQQLEEQGQGVNIARLEQQRLRTALIDAEMELQQAGVAADDLQHRLRVSLFLE